MRQFTRTRKSRQAAATVELAICLPVVLTIAFGTIDICSVLFLKESLTIAAYEGARAGMPWEKLLTATDTFVGLLSETPNEELVSVTTYSSNVRNDLPFSENYLAIMNNLRAKTLTVELLSVGA
jgi:Flp pilus assembly protein TadG